MKDAYSPGFQWNYRHVGVFILLAALPNLLGMINITTPFGFKLHFFQFAIFAAAFMYGPMGGLASGAVGSVYAGVMMHNPYLVVGNAILGLCAGLFSRKGFSALSAVFLAFAIQLPWLVITDIYLVGLSWTFVGMLIIALAVSNAIWAVCADYAVKLWK